MDPEVEKCAAVLVKKAGDTNQFIAEAARRTSDAMALHCTETRVISALIAICDHRAP